MPLPFNKSLDLKLIQLVKEHQFLYNPSHPEHGDLDTREVTWQKIGDALSRSGKVCKSRWINIRDMMRRKYKDSLKNNRIRKYKYQDELSFTIPYFKENVEDTDYAEYLDDNEDNTVFLEEDDEAQKDIKDLKQERDTENIHELNTTDPLDVFLLTIGATMRKFSPYYLNQAKSKIFQVVQDYELQQIIDTEGEPSTSADRLASTSDSAS